MKTFYFLLLLSAAYVSAQWPVDELPFYGEDRAAKCCHCVTRIDKQKTKIGPTNKTLEAEVKLFPLLGTCSSDLRTYSTTVFWGDGQRTEKTFNRGLTSFTEKHTYKDKGCYDILVMYGHYFPYCGEYIRKVVKFT